MATDKLDLPDDLLSSKPSDHSWASKLDVSGGKAEFDDSKDQGATDSSIPLSPQWLYTKPSDSKMDVRASALGNSTDPSQKEGWRLDGGTEDKKDWRRIATENEGSRRWREEERETGLLSGRRDRRKPERNVSVREGSEGRTSASSDRWNDGNVRSSVHEARRDTKWSSRWGPEDKEKETRTEKKTEVEKEKEDAHNDNQSTGGSNRPAPERETESRDRWRPRHRMEVHSSTPSSYRAAPGFGLERGRVEGSNVGFTVGRGRSNAIGRSSSAGLSGSCRSNGSVPGKPSISADTFCYPRGKLLDIYRRQKLDPSFSSIPTEMEESPSITKKDVVEPLAFIAPDTEEQAILNDIWNGKVTNSGLSREGQSAEDFIEFSGGKQDTSNSALSGENIITFEGSADDGAYQATEAAKMLNQEAGSEVSTKYPAPDLYELTPTIPKNNGGYNGPVSQNWQVGDAAFAKGCQFDDNESAASMLPDVSNSLYTLASSEQNQTVEVPHVGSSDETGKVMSPQDLSLCYVDPHGVIQGPFVGADIILWFDEGYFGTDLPVRPADAPEGTPFQELGDIMPHLKVKGKGANVNNASPASEHSGVFGRTSETGMLASAPPSETSDSAVVNELNRPSSEFNRLPAQRTRSKKSEAELLSQLPHSEGTSLNDFITQDEEILFSGRPNNYDYSVGKPSGSVPDTVSSSFSHLALPNELSEPNVPNQNDNTNHPFGLLWSELESANARPNQLPNMPSNLGKGAHFGGLMDQASAGETWSDVHRKNNHEPNVYQDPMAAHLMSRMDQESKHFDLAEQLMSRQFRQQHLQQQNMIHPHARLNDTVLDQVSSPNLIHQQLGNIPGADMEHLLSLQLQQQQQQRQLQLQLQQQQQFHKQQKLLQERQQSQARQVLLEHLLHGSLPDPGLGQPHVDPVRSNNVLDQVLLEHHMLHELQQQSNHTSRHFLPSLEQQLLHAKFGQVPQQDNQRDLFDLISRHGQLHPLEHQALQEQLQARQQLMGSRQRVNVEEDRHMDSIWPADETDQFLRTHSGANRALSSGFGQLDFFQQQQRPHIEEQLGHLERNHSVRERLRHGLFEPGSMPFERTMSLPAGASGINHDIINAMARGQGLDMQDLSARLQPPAQLGNLSSGMHLQNTHHHIVPSQFHASHLDANEGHWSDRNGQLPNDWMESRTQQLHINTERQKREMDAKLASEDPNLWMSHGSTDDKSRQLLMDLLHQKTGHQATDSLNMNDRASLERKGLSGLYPGSSSLDHPSNVLLDQEAIMNDKFAVGSYGSTSREPPRGASSDEQAGNLDGKEKLFYVSSSKAFPDADPFFSGINKTAQGVYKDSNMIPKSSQTKDLSELEGSKRGCRSEDVTKGSVFEVQDGIPKLAGLATVEHGEIPINSLSRHSSLGIYNEKTGPATSFVEDIAADRVPIPSKGQDSILLRRPPPRASASQEALSELVSDVRGKNPSVDGGRRETGVVLNQGSDTMASSKKDNMRFRRPSSCSDTDVSEASFIDMLKSNVKKPNIPEVPTAPGISEPADATQGRGGKKKGKKGRQIDPALLGFKVTSNRIMMGEIQRIED